MSTAEGRSTSDPKPPGAVSAQDVAREIRAKMRYAYWRSSAMEELTAILARAFAAVREEARADGAGKWGRSPAEDDYIANQIASAAYERGVRDERERLLQRLHDDPDNVADWNDCCRRAASAMEADLRAAAPEAKEPDDEDRGGGESWRLTP